MLLHSLSSCSGHFKNSRAEHPLNLLPALEDSGPVITFITKNTQFTRVFMLQGLYETEVITYYTKTVRVNEILLFCCHEY